MSVFMTECYRLLGSQQVQAVPAAVCACDAICLQHLSGQGIHTLTHSG